MEVVTKTGVGPKDLAVLLENYLKHQVMVLKEIHQQDGM